MKRDLKAGHRLTPAIAETNSIAVERRSVCECVCEHLELLQGACNERLAGRLLPAQSEHVLHALLKGLPLRHQVGRLHHDQEQVLHLGARWARDQLTKRDQKHAQDE